MRNAVRFLLLTLLFLAGAQELCASIPKTRVGKFFPLAANPCRENALQVPELRLDNPALYGGNASGDTFWTKFDPEGLETFDNGTDVTRNGHHVSPVETWKDPKGNVRFSKDVTDNLNEVRINPENGQKVKHGWSDAHQTYSDRAEAITSKYVEEAKKAGINPSGLSGKEAKEFSDGLVKELQNDKYINRFNEMVRQGKGTTSELNAMRKAALAEGIIHDAGILARAGEAVKGFGKFFKHLGLAGDVLMLGGAVMDAKEHGAKEAASNFMKSATFYDVTVEPAGKATMNAMDGLIHIGGPDTGRNQMERMLREDQ